MSPTQDARRCRRCGVEPGGTDRLADQADAAGLCSDCRLDVPSSDAVNRAHGAPNGAEAAGTEAFRPEEQVMPAPSRGRTLVLHREVVKDLIAAAYRVLTTRHFRDCAGNPADPESSALQALLDGIDAAEGRSPRHVVHCRACDTAPHNGLKHGADSSLGAVGAPCHVPGCRCSGYRPCYLKVA